jgi:hypothetical protein
LLVVLYKVKWVHKEGATVLVVLYKVEWVHKEGVTVVGRPVQGKVGA